MTTYKLTILSSFTHAVWKGDYRSNLEGEALLEEIFRNFNRVDGADVHRLTEIGFNQPSLSAGDVVAIDGPVYPQIFICDTSGWREVRPGWGVRKSNE